MEADSSAQVRYTNNTQSVAVKNNIKGMIEGGNPFANGPKLHLYKRNRRLQTSSATRTGSVTN
jgi:hypothetical protein